MSLILNIETSTSVCSVALSEGEEVVFEKASFEGPSHAALLGVYMEEALEAAKSKGMKLDAVAVSSGPGSYTGLRIGVSVAKGLCFGYGIPLIGIHTLDILASAAIRKIRRRPIACIALCWMPAVWKSTLRFMIPISTRYVPRLLIS